MSTGLTDGVVFLRPLRLQNAPDHLAGEDDEMARWVSGGHSTLADVQHYITVCQENWRTDGPIRAFGVFDCASGKLIGSIEASLAYRLVPGQVNISYDVFPGWGRRGIARRARSHEFLFEARHRCARDGGENRMRQRSLA